MSKLDAFPRVSVEPLQSRLGLTFDEFEIKRTEDLLERSGLKVHLVDSEEDFGFNHLTEPPSLAFELLASATKGWESFSSLEAHRRLEELANRAESMPLCLWAIDTVLGYRQDLGVEALLPDRPNPERKLIVMTQGLFSDAVGGEYTRNIALIERPEGGFRVKCVGRLEYHILYEKPGWDIVALCVPRSVCVMRT